MSSMNSAREQKEGEGTPIRVRIETAHSQIETVLLQTETALVLIETASLQTKTAHV